MPPRYAYWTIIVDDQPTAFRSGSQEELMPTFKRLKSKNDTAVMMWFQNGRLWPSRIDAQEAMHARGELGRRGDERQGGFRDRERKPASDRRERSAWTPRGEPSTPAPPRNADDKLDWKPKGEFVPAPKRTDRPDWKPKSDERETRTTRPQQSDWKPKGSFDRDHKADWKPKGSFDRDRKPDWKPKAFDRPAWKPSGDESRSAKPEWKPKGSFEREPRSPRADWKPKGSFDRERKPEQKSRSVDRPAWKPAGDDSRSAKPEWKPKGSFEREPRSPRADWKPKGSFDRERKSEWKPKERSGGSSQARTAKPEWKPKPSRPARPEWKPKGDAPAEPRTEKRPWVPKAEYKKSMGIEARRDKNWRPGGEHKDPRQKYKDAKKAKWSRFKQNIRARSGGKGKKSS